jgi:hypothetical protein
MDSELTEKFDTFIAKPLKTGGLELDCSGFRCNSVDNPYRKSPEGIYRV